MNTYRFTTTTRCGRTDVIVQNADTLTEAKEKMRKHNELKHTPMRIVKLEVKINGYWYAA